MNKTTDSQIAQVDWEKDIDLIAFGGSAGSIRVLCDHLPLLNPNLKVPLVLAIHRSPKAESMLITVLQTYSPIPIIEPMGPTKLEAGKAYIAPPDRHLVIDDKEWIHPEQSDLVQYSRPSIDVMFFSAADVFRERLLGILVTGANADGVNGLRLIKDFGGKVAVQDFEEALIDYMPKTASEQVEVDVIGKAQELFLLINTISDLK